MHAGATGGLAIDEEAIVGGESFPLILDPAGSRPVSVSSGRTSPTTTRCGCLAAMRVRRRRCHRPGRRRRLRRPRPARRRHRRADPGVLDAVFDDAYDRDLGVTWVGRTPKVAVWAPTAKDVDLLVRLPGEVADTRVEMRRDGDGVWSVTGRRDWKGASYLFEVDVYVPNEDEVLTNTVTDPYALALTTDSARAVIVDLDDPALVPPDWPSLAKPELAQPEDSTIYELHVRDFSINDGTVPAGHRGGYLAFTHAASDGMRHLRRARRRRAEPRPPAPGVRHRHDPRTPRRPVHPGLRPRVVPAGLRGAAGVRRRRGGRRRVQLGLRPVALHDAGGLLCHRARRARRARCEFRQMVAALNAAGLRVVMDVVYNHTTASGQDAKSVLDRIVPGYYHRLSSTGTVETSTCCANTASEHRMMEKLMVDSVVTWAREYKVDGFRFDLMGHHSLANMLAVREALDDLTLDATASTDGGSTCTARAGTSARWPTGRRFTQARQLELAGTGIGSFSDRLRDAVRGGGPFDANPRIQGFATGLFTDPNGDADQRDGRAAAGAAAPSSRPDQGRPRRQPARLRVRRPNRRHGHRSRRRLQRSARRLCRRPLRDDHLRGRPRQRDAVRHRAVQVAAAARRWATACG